MSRQGKRLLLKILIWLVAEMVLNFVNLDTLSDYSEFVFEPTVAVTDISYWKKEPTESL